MEQPPRPDDGARATGEPSGEQAPPQLPPAIWAGSLLDYNNGILHGEWLAVDGDAAALHHQVQDVLARSPTMAATGEPAEEWGIFDTDNFGGLRIGEYESLDTVAAWAAGIREHGPAYAAWASLDSESNHEADGFSDAYIGDFARIEDYAEQLFEDAGLPRLLDDHVPQGLRQYVTLDSEGLAHDLQMSGELQVVFHEGGVWLFHNS